MRTPLEKLTDWLRKESHDEDAEALILVDELMRAYAFSGELMDERAKHLSQMLRNLVGDWGINER